MPGGSLYKYSCSQSGIGDGFLWSPWRAGLPFQKTTAHDKGLRLSSLSSSVHQGCFLRSPGVQATPSLGFPTHIHQEWGRGKGHRPYAVGTRWDFTCTAGITSVTLQGNFPMSHTGVPLMCAFNPSDLPLRIHFYPEFYQGEGLIFKFFYFLDLILGLQDLGTGMQYVGGIGRVAKPHKTSLRYHHVTVPVRHHHPGEALEHGGSPPYVTKTQLCPDPGHVLQKRGRVLCHGSPLPCDVQGKVLQHDQPNKTTSDSCEGILEITTYQMQRKCLGMKTACELLEI